MSIAMKKDRLALDRATVRRSSMDGYLHVEISPISKANVCGYFGREIPDSEALGLDANTIYQLLRDPVELAKAAPTFNHIPLLNAHIPASAESLPKEAIVGSTGTESTFAPPYLTNSLVIWDASSIAGIETGEQRELSSSYRYVADMTPGEFEGVPYDGRMTNIVGNHVALVSAGRAGTDVLVGDSLPPELSPMKPSKKVAVRAALGAYLRPLLAQDGTIPQINVLMHGNKPVAQIATDAKSVFPTVDAKALTNILTLAHDEADEDDKAKDEEETEEEKAAREAREAKEKSKDNAKDSDETAEEKKAREDKEEEDRKKDKANDRKATDAAIQKARTDAMSDFQAIRQAERDVQPMVGDVIGMDSAEAIYRFALDAAGIDTAGVHASALRPMVELVKSRPASTAPSRVAMDAAGNDDFDKRFNPPQLKVI